MRKAFLIAAVLGALWMILLILLGSVRLAYLTNYIGLETVRWLPQARGIAPPINYWIGNVWLVLTSAVQWGILGALGHKLYKVST